MIQRLKVGLMFQTQRIIPVGEMLHTESGVIYFQFNPLFLQGQISLSPFKLKAVPEPQTPSVNEASLFDGLFGVFSDSLPDGWGLLMMSRAWKKTGKDFLASSALDRLSYIGRRAMGALVYEPASENSDDLKEALDIARLAEESERVMEGKSEDILDELMVLGGSPGGARPKVLVGVEKKSDCPVIVAGVDDLPEDFEHWIIKFNGKFESPEAGIVEYIYSETARRVGIPMPETRLFPDQNGQLWFGVKRFDRGPDKSRIHMHSIAGLVHASFRLPTLDYEDLLKITAALTRREDDVLMMFRMAAFNVIFHNRDDHAKNFAFLLSESGDWRLAPAFDLTWSAGPGGEHTTAVLGEGKAPGLTHLLELAKKRGLKKSQVQRIIDEVETGQSIMRDLFSQYQIKEHPVLKLLSTQNK